jgi:hypothetical protein
MEADMTEVDRAIESYKAGLAQAAELAPRDVAEIEDHLRTLIEDLRASGIPLAQAIEHAARRLGDPARIAREHARVRTPFGARLSRLRTWSALALIVPALVMTFAFAVTQQGWWSLAMLQGVLGAALAIALVARVGWARPFLLGGIAFSTATVALGAIAFPSTNAIWLVVHLGLVAFLWPWRRGELSKPGIALALEIWTLATAMYVLRFSFTTRGESLYIVPAAQAALVLALVSGVGCVARARWSAFASVGSAALLGSALVQITGLTFRFDTPDLALFMRGTLALVGSGVVTGAIAAALAWRTARTTFGSFRGALAR